MRNNIELRADLCSIVDCCSRAMDQLEDAAAGDVVATRYVGGQLMRIFGKLLECLDNMGLPVICPDLIVKQWAARPNTGVGTQGPI